MSLSEASSFNFSKLMRGKDLVVLDFYAPWCGPCKMLSNSIGELSGEYDFIKVDIDAQESLKTKYDIMSVPTLVFLKDGEEVRRETGYMPAGAIKEILENL